MYTRGMILLSRYLCNILGAYPLINKKTDAAVPPEILHIWHPFPPPRPRHRAPQGAGIIKSPRARKFRLAPGFSTAFFVSSAQEENNRGEMIWTGGGEGDGISCRGCKLWDWSRETIGSKSISPRIFKTIISQRGSLWQESYLISAFAKYLGVGGTGRTGSTLVFSTKIKCFLYQSSFRFW